MNHDRDDSQRVIVKQASVYHDNHAAKNFIRHTSEPPQQQKKTPHKIIQEPKHQITLLPGSCHAESAAAALTAVIATGCVSP